MTLPAVSPSLLLERPSDALPFLVGVDANGDRTTTVRPRGECDLLTSPHLATALNDLFVASTPCVVLDLDSLSFMDASGVRVVATMAEAFAEADLSLVVTCHRSNIVKLFRICGLEHLLAS